LIGRFDGYRFSWKYYYMFTLPTLPYPIDGLEPHISQKTLEFHHGKHHAGYTKKLNDALADHPDLLEKTIEELLLNFDALIPDDKKGAVKKNGAQFYNHSLYWISMSPNGGGEPVGDLANAIEGEFGSFESFKDQFIAAGATQFGSGWAWLSLNADGSLVIDTTPNEDTPLMEGKTPLMVMDVWEHAYYLDYQNRRPDYISAFFEVVDWEGINTRYLELKK
jgi:Fe-Mn family superoxide dismutase